MMRESKGNLKRYKNRELHGRASSMEEL